MQTRPGSTARVLLSLARTAQAKGVMMPSQSVIAKTIGCAPDTVYLTWKKLQDAGIVRARVAQVGQCRRVFVEEVRG